MKRLTTVLAVLERARSLLAKPGKWIQYAYTKRVGTKQCFCATAAIYHAAGYDVYRNLHDDSGAPLARSAVQSVTDVLPKLSRGMTLENWNDSTRRTQAQVVRLFDRAIKKAQTAALL